MNMSARKIHQSWWVDFRHDFKRHRIRSPENSRRGAEAYERLLRAKLVRGELIGRDRPAAITFGAFAQCWLVSYVDVNCKHSDRLAKRSILRVHLLPFFAGDELQDISAAHVERYKAKKLSSGLSQKTVNNHLTVLHKALATAMEWGQIASVPTVKWLRPMRPNPEYLQPDEVARLVDTPMPSPWREMMLLALDTGMRIGELMALDWAEVDLERGTVLVRRSATRGVIGTPKSNRMRLIPLRPAAVEMLCTIRGKARPPLGFVFTVGGQLLAYNTARTHLKRAARIAGLGRLSWHVLRHTFASNLVERGAGMRAVQLLLGHSTIVMTERYTHLAPSSLRSTVELLNYSRRPEESGQPVGNGTNGPWHDGPPRLEVHR